MKLTLHLLAAIYAITLNVLNVLKYLEQFRTVTSDYHDLFWKAYHVSGYDLHTYSTVSRWDVLYDVYRHPLLAFAMYIPSQMNQWLIALTGSNWASVIVGALWAASAYCAFILLFRILHDLMRLRQRDALLLCCLFASMAYVMLATFVPDHFGPSMTLLLAVIYFTCRQNISGRTLTAGQTAALYLITAGVTLSNGIKVLTAALINRRRKFFQPRYLLLAVALPTVLLLTVAQAQQELFVKPKAEAQRQKLIQKDRKYRAEIRRQYLDTATNVTPEAVEKGIKNIIRQRAKAKYRRDHLKPWNANAGRPIAKGQFIGWTDISTSRWKTVVENLCGEPLQFHDSHFLGDALRDRPAFVAYSHWYNYAFEAFLMLLAAIGVCAGRRNTVVQTAMAFLAFDMLIHLILGFGINEIYIMSPHFLFCIPIALAPLLRSRNVIAYRAALLSISAATIWMAWWNGLLMVKWF